jgi:hypothetical protein
MKSVNYFCDFYLTILNEESSPTTFTPVELLDDIKQKCFYSSRMYHILYNR